MKIVLSRFLIVVLVLFSTVVSAQDPPCPDGPCPEEPPGLPVDGNIVGLLIAGVLLGIYMIYRYNKTEASV